MKASFAIAAVFTASITTISAKAGIRTTGVGTSCGQNSCCIPSCVLTWSDKSGCDGQSEEAAGSCSNVFSGPSDSDTGVDICAGAGAFFCTTDKGNKVVYVVNKQDTVSAALFPAKYDECTLSGQCAPCDSQASCQDPVSIGTESDHNCDAFNALLKSSDADLKPC